MYVRDVADYIATLYVVLKNRMGGSAGFGRAVSRQKNARASAG